MFAVSKTETRQRLMRNAALVATLVAPMALLAACSSPPPPPPPAPVQMAPPPPAPAPAPVPPARG